MRMQHVTGYKLIYKECKYDISEFKWNVPYPRARPLRCLKSAVDATAACDPHMFPGKPSQAPRLCTVAPLRIPGV